MKRKYLINTFVIIIILVFVFSGINVKGGGGCPLTGGGSVGRRSSTRGSSLQKKQEKVRNLLKEARELYNEGNISKACNTYNKSASICLNVSEEVKSSKLATSWLNSYISITKEMAGKLEKEKNKSKHRKAIKIYNEIYHNYDKYNRKHSRKEGFVRNKKVEKNVSDCLAQVVCLGVEIKKKSDIKKAKDAYKILKKEFPQSAGIKKAEKARQEYQEYLKKQKSNKKS
jgi:hypothetical protein